MKFILRKGFFLFTALLFGSVIVNAQSMKQKVADKYFDQLNYTNAVEVYEDINSGKGKDYHSLKRTAECYRLMNNTEKAEESYKSIIVFGTNIPKDYYSYAQLLKRNGKYNLSDENMKLFYEKAGKGTFTSVPNFYNKLKSDSAYFVVSTLGINNVNSDISPYIYNNELLFVSNRREKKSSDIKVGWDGTNFLDIYNSGSVDSPSEPVLFFGKDLTKNSHDGPICFDTISNKIYITRNNITEKNQNKNLKIEIIENSNWDEIEEFPYNSDNYSVGHATLSPDGKTIYFTSNMPGSFGETDIWKSVLENGKWGTPINLGEQINTFDKEMFPYISPSGDLYFASQGHQGFGGLDIFVAYKNGDSFMPPVNMGYPINTRFDDFSFIILKGNKTGYFASNRVGGVGADDIYKVEIKKQINKPDIKEEIEEEKLYALKGNLFDQENKTQLLGGEVILRNLSTDIVLKSNIEDNGFNFELGSNVEYEIIFNKEGYNSKTVKFETNNEIYEIVLNESLSREAISINNIFYDFNSSALRDESKSELDKLVKLLKEYPEMNIQINSHTDCRGNADYNLKLSQRRAQSVVNYLVSKGISKSRLQSKGYGESRHVNKCINNTIECSEAEYQENRRTEFLILQ